jgi:peptidyl-prolyl cis-trans isomerase C
LRFVLFAALALTACNTTPPAGPAHVPGSVPNEGELVMTVDGKPVHANQLDAIFENMPPQQVEMMKSSGQMGQLLDQVAMTQVLYQQAIDQGLHKEDDVKLALAMQERQVLAQALVMKKAKEAITDEAVQAWYDQRKVQFAKAEVKARHILVKEESKANELKTQLEGGADFATLAKEHSTDTGSGAQGGDLGWFSKDKMVAPFAEAAFAAEPGALVGPVETRFGFHLIKVEDKRDAKPLDEVRPQAEEALMRETVTTFTNEVKANMKVEKKGEYADMAPPAAPPGADPHGKAPGGAMPPGHPPGN